MPRLSTVQLQVRQSLDALAHRRLPPSELAAELLEAINTAVPADGWVLYGVEPSTLLFNRVLGYRTLGDQDAQTLVPEYLANAYLVREPPNLSPPGLMRAGVRATVSRDRLDACWGLPPYLVDDETAGRWRDFYREDIGASAGGSVSAYFRAGRDHVAALDGFRLEGDRPFQDHEARFLQLMGPVVGEALRSALERERTAWPRTASTPDQHAPGVVILTSRNRIQYCSPDAERCLAAIAHGGIAVAAGVPALPIAIWSAIARHRMQAAPVPAQPLVLPTRQGRIRIDIANGGEDGSVVVVLSPERPPTLPDLPPEWGLTPTEGRVVRKVAEGCTNVEIGAALHMTAHTVESHLGRVYEKTSARSRSHLMARLFQVVVLPAINLNGGKD